MERKEPVSSVIDIFHQEPQSHHVRLHGEIVTRITVFSPFRMRIQRSFGKKDFRDLPFIQREALGPGKADSTEDGDAQCEILLPSRKAETIQSHGLWIDIAEDGSICCRSQDGILFREVPGRHLVKLDGRMIHSFRLDGCLYYGFGETTGPLEKTGCRMRFGSKDACGYDPEHTDPLYKHIPFFLKLNPEDSRVCGVFYHTAADCELDMGREFNGYYPPMGQFITPEDSVDYFLFFGDTMADVLEDFTFLTGRPAMLPEYALGYLGSSMYYPELPRDCDREILAFCEKAGKLGVPCSNFQLSSGYTTDSHHRRNIFTWNTEKFPDPRDFILKMKLQGVSLTPNVKPAMLTTHPLYGEFAEAKAFIRNEDGSPYVTRFWGGQASFVDFTNPGARQLWKTHLKESLLDYGIRCIWNDNNEFDLTGGYCYDEGRYTPAPRLRAVLPLLMAQAGFEAIRECYPHHQVYQVSRSGCAGINRYAQVWTGDNYTSWESLKWNIATMLGSSLSGMPLTGSDVGGFAGPAPDRELFLRWIACGILMPRFSIHSANNDNTVTEPWMYSSQLDKVRSLFDLRSRLMPLLSSLHLEAHFTGKPIWRPMVWQFPEDKRCHRESVDFFLGDGLLCPCVVEKGAQIRKVWLPEGTVFYDFDTRERYQGGREITLNAPLGKALLLQRGGSIVPTQETDGLHLWICPEGNCYYTHYSTGGNQWELPLEQMQNVTIRVSSFADTITISKNSQAPAHPAIRQTELQCRDKAPCRLIADHVNPLPRYLDKERFEACSQGWYYDAESSICSIRCENWSLIGILMEAEDLIKIDGN